MEYIESYGMRELDQDEVNIVSGGYIPVSGTFSRSLPALEVQEA